MSGRYVLDADGNPVAEPDLMRWARWFEASGEKRTVARDREGGCLISTIFLGLDHGFGRSPPLLYETGVFDEGHMIHQRRYATRDEAIRGHADVVVELVAGSVPRGEA